MPPNRLKIGSKSSKSLGMTLQLDLNSLYDRVQNKKDTCRRPAQKILRKKTTKATIAQDLAGQHGPLMVHYCPKLRPQTTKTIAQIKNHYLDDR